MNKKIFIFTMKQEPDAAKNIGIFLESEQKNAYDILNDTEIDVWELLSDEESDFIRCGCVTGYNESFFTETDWQLYKMYGLNKHFEFESGEPEGQKHE